MKNQSNSTIERSKVARGTIVTGHGRDDSSMSVPKAKEAKGGVNNLAHSLSGASAVQDVK